MTRLFVDTSFYIGLLRPDDAQHRRCLTFDADYRGTYVTSEFVLIELANWLADEHNRLVFAELVELLRSDPRTTILPASSEWFARGLELYVNRRDKSWALTDCITFQMMREHGLTDALTADHHFTQAGFNAVLARS